VRDKTLSVAEDVIKVKKDIDESAWSALDSTTSYPFEKPKTGKIAVKVIND
jgi:adenine-specific DNA-methyltransferase